MSATVRDRENAHPRVSATVRDRKNASSVSEIAYDAGFRSVAHFSTRFRERFGQTPSAWRRQPG